MTISEYALKFVGSPYIWGGDGSGAKFNGWDCSGLVLECLWAFGILPKGDMTAQGINDILYGMGWRQGLYIKEGDILFFGKDTKHITHVALAISESLMVEAGGGGSKCKTPATSTGMVWVRPIAWRDNLVAALREP